MNVDSQYEIHGPLARDSYDADVIEENNNIARSKDLRQFDYSHDQLTVRNIIETQTLSSFRTTSLDFLREMLGRNLDHPNPAPQHIGQLNKDLMLPVTQKLFRLEDYYDPLSADKTIREDFTSCESQRVQCISNTDYNLAVCVIDMTIPESVEATLRVKGFHSMCEVTYRNCLKRYELTGKNYADHYSEDYLEFFHYGWCQQCFNLIDNCPG
ncbi:uncharacterized protein LOC125238386 [Leguminivora glycinivorella]|uniref:uncharacterized protein LOC125238386 n=1 Tax=Leguminivora glycinivorella TaxID=1035111 RepID=UPI00200D4DED|nr:uncharacterized protein LOC125238386 [Leguminivora glycinivorella]